MSTGLVVNPPQPSLLTEIGASASEDVHLPERLFLIRNLVFDSLVRILLANRSTPQNRTKHCALTGI